MVQAIINITEHSNRILNIIKARYGLNDKSKAIDMMAQEYEKNVLQLELRPEYVKKALKIDKERSIYVGNTKNLRKMCENVFPRNKTKAT
jgi:hypothetical protein